MKSDSELNQERARALNAIDGALACAVAGFEMSRIKTLLKRLKEEGWDLSQLRATQEAFDAVTTVDLKAMEKWKPKATWTLRRQATELMQEAGWEVSQEAWHAMIRRALSPCVKASAHAEASSAIGWLLKKGAFNPGPEPSGTQTSVAGQGSVLAWVFNSESDEQLKVMKSLVAARVLREGGATVGLTDFAILGLWKCAKSLSALGFTPHAAVGALKWSNQSPEMDRDVISVCARALAYQLSNLADKGQVEVVLEQGLEGLGWLKSLGAPVAGPGLDPLGDFAECRAKSWVSSAEVEAKIINKLVELGANPNASKRFLVNSVKCWVAACEGAADSAWDGLGHALEHGANPRLWPGASLGACGALKRKSRQGGERAMLRLIRAGANPKECQPEGSSFEHPAAAFFRRNAFDSGRLALELGAPDSWREVNTGNTLLHLVASNSGPESGAAMSRLLKRPGLLALLNAKNESGRSPLMIAVQRHALGTLKALIAAGANPNEQDVEGVSALALCMDKSNQGARSSAERGGEVLVIELLKAGADPDLCDALGLTPGQTLILNGMWGGLELLLESRPEHVLGEKDGARMARQEFESRGPRARSIIQRLQLSTSIGPGAELVGAAPSVRPRL